VRSVVLGLLLVIVSDLALASSAPDEPVVRIQLQPKTVAVGEAAELRVTVLGPTWFPKPPVFPSFEVPNAIVRRPPDRSGPATEQVGGERWSGVYRTYQVFPLMGARYSLGGETLQVTVANPGSDPVVSDLTVPSVTLIAEVPEGAEGLDPYIAGQQFSVRRQIEGALDQLEVGDALVVRYIAELDGLPAIFLPPLAPAIESRTVSVYADTPVFEEGDTSTRTEQITIVMNYGGDVVLPALSFRWWNRATNQVEVASVDALTIAVAGPSVEARPPGERQSFGWRDITLLILALIVTGYLLMRYVPLARQWLDAERERYLDSEQHAFDRLKKTCRSQDAGAAYTALLAWQLKLCPDTDLRRLAGAYGSQPLIDGIDGLTAHLFAGRDSRISLGHLAREAAIVRERYLAESKRAGEMALPHLNPGPDLVQSTR
jgi:hypothetical protein